MNLLNWTTTIGTLVIGATLSGCCVAPVGAYHDRGYYGGPRYGGRVVYEQPAPVIVAPPPRHWRWRHY